MLGKDNLENATTYCEGMGWHNIMEQGKKKGISTKNQHGRNDQFQQKLPKSYGEPLRKTFNEDLWKRKMQIN